MKLSHYLRYRYFPASSSICAYIPNIESYPDSLINRIWALYDNRIYGLNAKQIEDYILLYIPFRDEEYLL